MSNKKFFESYKTLDLALPDEAKVFFISDTHFGHKNLIDYIGRPFSNVDEMNKTIALNWNRVVGDDDHVIFVGDFVCGVKQKSNVCNLYHKFLNGKKIMIKGNHDTIRGLDYTFFHDVRFERYGKKFICRHFPDDPKKFDCDIAIVGHSHSNNNPTKSKYLHKGQINVSCELIDYTPILLTRELVNGTNWK